MAIDPLSTWQDMLAILPKVGDNTWALNFGAYVANRVVTMEPDPTQLILAAPVPVGFTFIFEPATFAAQLLSLTPTSDPLSGITSFADAWENTIKGIIFPVSLNVLLGAIVPPASPATTFSTITAVSISPESIALGKAKIVELATAPPVSDPKQSLFAVKFREAFLELKITVTGVNSVAPTPAPLTAPNISLI